MPVSHKFSLVINSIKVDDIFVPISYYKKLPIMDACNNTGDIQPITARKLAECLHDSHLTFSRGKTVHRNTFISMKAMERRLKVYISCYLMHTPKHLKLLYFILCMLDYTKTSLMVIGIGNLSEFP